jgi:DNA-binding transcriptional ArsR family regulator
MSKRKSRRESRRATGGQTLPKPDTGARAPSPDVPSRAAGASPKASKSRDSGDETPGASRPRNASGAPWPARAAAPTLSMIDVEIVLEMLSQAHPDPSAADIASCIGLSAHDVAPRMRRITDLGLPARLSRPQRQCLRSLLEWVEQYGESPTTRELSERMGLSPSASRFHVERLVALGLIERREVRIVLDVTRIGRAHLDALERDEVKGDSPPEPSRDER